MSPTWLPRNVRNCNPGNLERSSAEWLGLATLAEMTSWQRAETRFCVFKTPAYGFRALALDLYDSWKKGRATIPALIGRFAPPNENNTKAYIDVVSAAVALTADEALNLDDDVELSALCKAIATHESGGWLFHDADLAEGLRLMREPVAPRLNA